MVKPSGDSGISPADEQALAIIRKLVKRYAEQRDTYQRDTYKEAQLRPEFIDPFFEALGWDVANRQGLAEAYKDVIHEDAIKVHGATKAPDYCFRIGGTRKFFVEAKKPSVRIREEVPPAFQLRRYAWSAKLPLSILTDFEEFAVYDCRSKPVRTDKASTARVMYVTFDQYVDRWEQIASIFSRQAVLRGYFDRYADTTKRKRGTAEVDAAFLEEIEAWRDLLARNLALRNPRLSQRELNFAVQRTIDRTIFLRICEDRAIEPHGQLQSLLNGTAVYRRLGQMFRRADERYNSGLFHFQEERGRPTPPDELTLRLKIDDKLLKQIIKGLYYPDSPYEFAVLPADILGQVYEQFLGKVIRLTRGHRAVVEDKPEVKKAGGVYYTPTYIVDYIVKHTVGRLLGVPGSGAGAAGTEERNHHGTEDVSRSGSVAEGHRTGRVDLSPSQEVSPQGEIRAEQPDPKGGGVRSSEHRRGLRQNPSGGLPPSSLHSQRLADGGRNPADHRRPPETHNPPGCPAHLGADPTSRPDAQQAHRRPQAKTRDPAPETRNPKPKALTPKDASRLRILDPACGSGSFLIAAYQYLLDWHLNWYSTHDPHTWARKKDPPIFQSPSTAIRDPGAATRGPKREPLDPNPGTPNPNPAAPTWRLTTAERKRILLNNIFGVDIDPQAVEVTKLSLLLKVLEGETEQTLAHQLRLFHERALPDLASNIKCGNSLIGPDFYDNRQMSLLDDEERYRINVFDWHAEFPEIMGPRERGLGARDRGKGRKAQPPTPSPQRGFDAVIGNPPYILLQTLDQSDVFEHLRRHYRAATYKIDTYQVFLERGIHLAAVGGYLGYITPNTFLRNKHAVEIRRVILEKANVQLLRIFFYQVFPASVDTSIVILKRTGNGADPSHRAHIVCSNSPDQREGPTLIAQEVWLNAPGLQFSLPGEKGSLELLRKMEDASLPLGEFATSYFGIQTYDRKRFVSQSKKGPQWKRVVDGGHINRYSLERGTEFVDFRAKAVKSGGKGDVYERLRIGVRQIGEYPIATLIPAGLYTLNTIYNIFFVKQTNYDLHFILAVISSSAVRWYWRQMFFDQKRTFPKIKKEALLSVPVPRINFEAARDKAAHAQVVGLVARILDLYKELARAQVTHEKTALARQIDATDRQIDRLVYELYGLSEEEIRIVEEATSS